MTKDEMERKRVEAYKALECIFVAVQDSVARDLNFKVRAYINAIAQERAVLKREVAELKEAAAKPPRQKKQP